MITQSLNIVVVTRLSQKALIKNSSKYSLAESDCDAGRCCWDGRPRATCDATESGIDESGFVS